MSGADSALVGLRGVVQWGGGWEGLFNALGGLTEALFKLKDLMLQIAPEPTVNV